MTSTLDDSILKPLGVALDMEKRIVAERGTEARIYLKNLDKNIELVRKIIGDKKICMAVKADAYGHGAVEVSRQALKNGIDYLGVATIGEAMELRSASIKAPILLFSLTLTKEIKRIVELDVSPFVCDLTYLEALNREGEIRGKRVGVHLKIDTGMGRIGAAPEDILPLCRYIDESPFLIHEGTCTHLSVSDSPEKEDRDFTKKQIEIFSLAIKEIKMAGMNPGICHAANSGGILEHSDSHFQMVRPGICLYGYYPDRRLDKKIEFKPLMEFASSISFLKKIGPGTPISYGRTWISQKETLIASISAGYGDGYSRLLSSKGRVLVGKKSCPVRGRICMDQFMVEIELDSQAAIGDEVILFGPGENSVDASDLAEMCQTISYEICCGINQRVPRIYIR